MPASKGDVLKALDDALAESVKQGFANLVADAAGSGRTDALNDEVGRFAKGLRLKLDCHARAAAAVGKVMT